MALSNPLLPPWLKYPKIPPCSIGWRMGYGESYLMELSEWMEKLTDDESVEYEQMFPAPVLWESWYRDEIPHDSGDSLLYDYQGRYFIKFWRENGEPKYNRAQTENDYRAGEKLKYYFFWGHQPSADGRINQSCLSQWWLADFSVGITGYCCMEQYMMAEKARLFGDKEIEEEIMRSKSPKNIKDLGRKVKNFREDIWDTVKYSIVLTGSYYKFIQNTELLKFLLSTDGKLLVEASPYDAVWGIKMGAGDKNAENPLKWGGQNLLGFALMELRDELGRVCAPLLYGR